jgi:hypothetical protein
MVCWAFGSGRGIALTIQFPQGAASVHLNLRSRFRPILDSINSGARRDEWNLPPANIKKAADALIRHY